MIAVDTNILVYARREELPQHARALAALSALAGGEAPWAIPVFCLVEFFRVVTHHRLFAPPTEPAAALRFVDALLASPTVRLLRPQDRFWPLFGELAREGGVRGNLAFDVQIAAVCIESGVSVLLTEDRDYARFRRVVTRGL